MMKAIQINYYTTLVCEQEDLSHIVAILDKCQVAQTTYENGKDKIKTLEPIDLHIRQAIFVEEPSDESPAS
jgi:hypothetical protein